MRAAVLPCGLLLTGCGCELPELVGADPYLEALIQPAIDRYFQATPAGMVCVSEVRVEEAHPDRAGRYARGRTFVEINEPHRRHEPWSEWNVEQAVTHELCHASQLQMGIPLDTEVDFPLEPAFEENYPRRKHDEEGFARACQVGPDAVQLLGSACPRDTARADVYPFLRAWAFPIRLPDVRDDTGALTPIQSTVPHGLDDAYWSVAASPPSAFVLRTLRGTPQTIDVWTGAHRPPQPEQLDGGTAGAPPGMVELAGATDGSRDLMVLQVNGFTGAKATRYVLRDEQDVLHRIGCAPDDARPFSVDGELFAAWREAGTLRWAHIDTTE